MDAISTRVNGQADYRPTPQARAAWREEMLDDLLSQMREHKLPGRQEIVPAKEAAVPGKGTFIDLYV